TPFHFSFSERGRLAGCPLSHSREPEFLTVSLPRLDLTTISQMLAILRKRSLPGSSINSLAWPSNWMSPPINQSKVSCFDEHQIVERQTNFSRLNYTSK